MNQTDLLQVEMPFSIADIKQPVVDYNRNSHFKLEKIAESSINNYLKTPDEIDAELSSSYSSSKTGTEYKDIFDMYGIIKKMNSNAYSPDYNPSGFMEENY